MHPKKRTGRPPAHPIEGAAKNYTIRLTPAQVARALQHGATINVGINALLRNASDVVDALHNAEFLMRQAGKYPGPMQDSFNRSADQARDALACHVTIIANR